MKLGLNFHQKKLIDKLLFLSLLSLFLSLKFYIYFFLIFIVLLSNTHCFVKFIKLCIPFLIVISSLLLFSLNKSSLGNFLPYPLYESRDILISVIIMSTLLAISTEHLSSGVIVKYITLLCVLVGVSKLAILAYCIKQGINPSFIVREISDATGWQLMTYDVDDSLISRIQFPIDLVGCFIIYFQSKITFQHTNKKNIFILGILFFSTLITMSRAFWFISSLLFVFSFCQSPNNKNKIKYFIVIMFAACSLYFSMFDSINSIIASRLDSSINSASDNTRVIQNTNIWASFSESPLLGHGIGYFIPSFTRGEGINKYAYESQALSMLMKLGVVGSITLLLSIMYIVFFNLKYSAGRKFRVLTIRSLLLSLWIFSGSVNPLLFSVPGGIVLYLVSIAE